MAISGYFIGGYWCLLMAIILVPIDDYFINDHWWVFINGYWWLFY